MSRHHQKLNKRKWAKLRIAIFERDAYRCCECGKAGALEVDHIHSMERQPNQDPYNSNGLQTLCRSCHWNKTTNERRAPDPERDAWRALVAEITEI